MSPLNQQDLLRAIRSGISGNYTGSNLSGVKSLLKRERRSRLYADPSGVATQKESDLKEGFDAIKLSAANFLALGEQEIHTHFANISDVFPTLPEDDPSPTVIDKKKIKTKTRALLADSLTDTSSRGQWLTSRIEGFKRMVVKDYQDTDPCEAKLAAALLEISNPSSEQALRTAIMQVQSLEHLMKPIQ